jgi:hypothetical protein
MPGAVKIGRKLFVEARALEEFMSGLQRAGQRTRPVLEPAVATP